ncbi:MAG: hypothetical protein FJZ92_10500 [Chloroflexi bacterium]|nr:hypothetical protein [Chloroflexota bacterium]
MRMTVPRTALLFGLIAAFAAVVAVGCGSGGGGSEAAVVTAPQAQPGAPPAQAPAAPRYDFPAGPAVLVQTGYTPPRDRIDSTGAHLPANGKPTLVFVDAIW